MRQQKQAAGFSVPGFWFCLKTSMLWIGATCLQLPWTAASAETKAITIDLAQPMLTAAQKAVLQAADDLLEQALVSYVYGGSRVGDGGACVTCNQCLTQKEPSPTRRLETCPICRDCSLDCSHFLQLVFAQAGYSYPYIETASMLALSSETLRRRYRLIVVNADPIAALEVAEPGDFLVYKGHVALLERLYPTKSGTARLPIVRGDLIHATGGRDIKAPGQGIQRERFADLANFRSPLRRILRHTGLQAAHRPRGPKAALPTSPPARVPNNLRPVVKNSAAPVP